MENHETTVTRFAACSKRAFLIPLWCVLGAAVVGLLMQGCSSSRRSEPMAGPLALDDQQRRGQRVFMKQCSQCHPGGEAGLGPAINNKPLPGFLIRFQVRHGLGAMPAFSEERVTDSELTDVIAYLKALRQHG